MKDTNGGGLTEITGGLHCFLSPGRSDNFINARNTPLDHRLHHARPNRLFLAEPFTHECQRDR